jgi:multiple sugar transport system substrate-binding protein
MVMLGRRRFLKGSAALMGGASLAAMTGSMAWAQASQLLRVSGFVESQEQLAKVVKVLEAYEAAHPRINIEPEFSGYGAFVDKLAVEAAGGNAPDVFTVNGSIAGEYSTRGVIMPLDKFVPEPLNLADYLPTTLQSVTIDGKLYGVPNDAIATSIVLNPAVFEETGVALPSADWTWEDLARTATEISKKKGRGFWGLEDAGHSYIFFDMFLRGRDKAIVDANRQWGFDVQDLADYWSFWENLRKSGGVPPADIQALANEDDPSTYGIVAGRAAMIMSLTDSYIGIQSLVPNDLLLHNVPNGFKGGAIKQRHYVYTGNAMSVWSKVKDPARAVDVIRYMHFDPQGSAIFYSGSGIVPAATPAREQLALNGSPAEKRAVAYINAIGQDSAQPRQRAVSGFGAAMLRSNQAIAFGNLTPRDAAEQIIREMTPNLKK